MSARARLVFSGAAALLLLRFGAGCTETTTTPPRPPMQEAKVVVCAPGSFMNGNECIPTAPQCPAETTLQNGQCVPLPVAQEELPPKPMEVAAPEPDNPYDAVLDSRRVHLQPRARVLLITEIQGLESLFQTVPKNAPDRPRLIRRLAEGYTELEAAAVRDRAQTQDRETIAKAEKIERAARQAAIKNYQRLLDEYPSFCLTSNAASPAQTTGCADEAAYYVSLEYIRAAEMDKARKSLLRLIQNFPASRFLGPAYFLFGEMFRKEAASDPSKWALAQQAYQEAAKYPGSAIAGPTLYRLAEVYEQQGDSAKARATLEKAKKLHPANDAATGNGP